MPFCKHEMLTTKQRSSALHKLGDDGRDFRDELRLLEKHVRLILKHVQRTVRDVLEQRRVESEGHVRVGGAPQCDRGLWAVAAADVVADPELTSAGLGMRVRGALRAKFVS